MTGITGQGVWCCCGDFTHKIHDGDDDYVTYLIDENPYIQDFVLLNEVACSSCVVACQKEPPPNLCVRYFVQYGEAWQGRACSDVIVNL